MQIQHNNDHQGENDNDGIPTQVQIDLALLFAADLHIGSKWLHKVKRKGTALNLRYDIDGVLHQRSYLSALSWRAIMLFASSEGKTVTVHEMDQPGRYRQLFPKTLLRRLHWHARPNANFPPVARLHDPEGSTLMLLTRSRLCGHAVDALHNLTDGGPVFQPLWISDIMALRPILGIKLMRDETFAPTLAQFLKKAKSRIKAVHALASRRPELLDNAAFSTLALQDVTGLLQYAYPDRPLMLRLAKRLFKIDDEQLARQVTEALGEVIIPPLVQSVINADQTPAISEAWSKQIGSFSSTHVVSCVLKSAKSTAALARGIQLMNFDISAGVQVGVSKWASQIQSLADDVKGRNRQELQSFLLSLALVTGDPTSEPLFEFSFEDVHSDIASSRLPYHAFSMLEPLLVRLPWYLSWDTCLRLRRSVVDIYVEAGLSRASFLRLSQSDDLMFNLIDLAKDSKRGRNFLKGR